MSNLSCHLYGNKKRLGENWAKSKTDRTCSGGACVSALCRSVLRSFASQLLPIEFLGSNFFGGEKKIHLIDLFKKRCPEYFVVS